MWIAEALLVVSFVVIGVARPTPHSDAFAKKRGIEESNRLKRERIRRAESDYLKSNPLLEKLYTLTIITFVVGFGFVMVFSIHAAGSNVSKTSTAMIVAGYVIQGGSLLVFAACALRKRKYIARSLISEEKQ
jgi:hypothetical protein